MSRFLEELFLDKVPPLARMDESGLIFLR